MFLLWYSVNDIISPLKITRIACSLTLITVIIEKGKKAVEKFEYDTSQMTILEVCNDIWKTISD